MRKTFNIIENENNIIKPDKHEIDGHRFYKIDGLLYPSVTTIISATQESDGLKKWREKLGHDVADFELIRCSNRGTKMHTLIEEYITGKKASIKEVLPRGLFDLIRPEVDKIDNIRMIEEVLYEPDDLVIAGTVDCIAEFDGVLSVIDFKSSNKFKRVEWIENYFIQACAYSHMYKRISGEDNPKQIVILIAGEDGTIATYKRDIDEDLIQKVREIAIQFYKDIMPDIVTGANYRSMCQ